MDAVYVLVMVRDVRAAGVPGSRNGSAVSSDLVGLIIACALVLYLVVALLFPERF